MFERPKNTPRPLSADYYLRPFSGVIGGRIEKFNQFCQKFGDKRGGIADFASGHEYFGLHKRPRGWVMREWLPNACKVVLVGDFTQWQELEAFTLNKISEHGVWELKIGAGKINHLDHYLLKVYWDGGEGLRVPAYARYVVQDEQTLEFSAQVWEPLAPYEFKYSAPEKPEGLLLYEAHIGMAQEEGKVGSYREFTDQILPKIAQAGYNTVQIMAVMNHPYYGSFGYHVSNYFSITSRFGNPFDFKRLVDTAHKLGLRVIMDIVHSHAVKNVREGLGLIDGSRHTYFHEGSRGEHSAWDSLCFDYGKSEVNHFLLSNCRFWLDEYKIDGFRFDGVTSMLYTHHGLGRSFTNYMDYFSSEVDEDAYTYLALANKVIHDVNPNAITVAEDVSGMPGLGAKSEEGGCGFDYRLAMGVTDYWFKLFDLKDEEWNMWQLWHELSNRRADERTVSYVECHDQAIVGGQTAIFRLIGKQMYTHMSVFAQSAEVDRGIALHKMSRLITAAAAGNGYLNFFGNEFGHPEWIDFPREGNGWSYHYARRQWSLATIDHMRYLYLNKFDQDMIKLLSENNNFGVTPQVVTIDDSRKVIAFERNGLWFFFNFHPHDSYVELPFQALAGEYELVLDSDSECYNGHNRIDAGQHYFTVPELWGAERVNLLKLYLPNRSALVLRKLN